MDNDQNIVMLAKDGNKEAVASLYENYFDPIYRFFYWQTNKNPEIAEDLTQDTFIEMAKSIHRFYGEGSFKNWLYTIAKRQLSKWLRSKYDLPKEPLFDNFANPEIIIDAQQQQQATKKVSELLAKISEKESSVIILRYLKNYSVKETAQELNISAENVKILAHRAIKKMRDIKM